MRTYLSLLIFLSVNFIFAQGLSDDFIIGNWEISDYKTSLCIDLESDQEIIGAPISILPDHKFLFRILITTEKDSIPLEWRWTIQNDTLIVRTITDNQFVLSGVQEKESLVLITDENFFTIFLERR